MIDFAMRDEEEAIAAAVVSELSFPVVLLDRDQEINVGRVLLLPSMNFKAFKSTISNRIGLAFHQFSVHVGDRHRRGFRIPVTEKTNFSTVMQNKGYFFQVLLKRSRRERRRRSPVAVRTTAESHRRRRFDLPGNVMLLRRGTDGYGFPRELDLGLSGYERRMKELQVEKERYLMNMGLLSRLGLESLSLDSGDRSRMSEGRGEGVVCEECSRGGDPEFHWCVHDPVTEGFRSPAGPISRPAGGAGISCWVRRS
ncbi:unnamed protein product [Linum trigynum]|uniref:DUF7138 domain-containing protein n=2 Tax=Linum trigynum TaxID=586398 RepID=A0AAV2F9P7_9ROSI